MRRWWPASAGRQRVRRSRRSSALLDERLDPAELFGEALLLGGVAAAEDLPLQFGHLLLKPVAFEPVTFGVVGFAHSASPFRLRTAPTFGARRFHIVFASVSTNASCCSSSCLRAITCGGVSDSQSSRPRIRSSLSAGSTGTDLSPKSVPNAGQKGLAVAV